MKRVLWFLLYCALFPVSILSYCVLYLYRSRKGPTVAIVLSYKRTLNIPLVVLGLRMQNCIDHVVVIHNRPSWLAMPNCENIFLSTNRGSIIRHDLAQRMEFENFIFCDDDLILMSQESHRIVKILKKYPTSVVGYFGINIGEKYKKENSIIAKQTTRVDIVKGRFHAMTKQGVETLAVSGLSTPALISEDDIRANAALQIKFGKPSYLLKYPRFFELPAPFALENRRKHIELRNQAIKDARQRGCRF